MSAAAEHSALCGTCRPAVLLQLPDGFVLIKRAEHARQVAAALIEAADDLDAAAKGSAAGER